jgi:hypothetical protein
VDSRVAGAIFDSTASSDEADGVQFAGQLSEVGEVDLASAMEFYFLNIFDDPEVRQRWSRPASDFVGAAPQRFYKIVIAQAFVLDPDSPKIDRRRPVNVERLLALRN